MRPEDRGIVIEDITDQCNGAEAEQQGPEKGPEAVGRGGEGECAAPAAAPERAAPAAPVERGPAEEASAAEPPGAEGSGADGDRAASLDAAEALKKEGNAFYAAERWQEAADKYTAALAAAPAEGAAEQRAVYLGNRAACWLKLGQPAEAAHDCSEALELQPGYIKVLLRRSSAYEALDDLERALADAQKVVELEPDNKLAAKLVQRLEPVVTERREKLKEEMMGKLKELGNTVLGKFGLSLDNFKAEKDPATGSYSIKFSQG